MNSGPLLPDGGADGLILEVACSKLGCAKPESGGWKIVADRSRFGYRVAIPNQPIVFVGDEEIHRFKSGEPEAED